MKLTERGKFRSIEMDDLARWANSPKWDDEWSKNRYCYPLRISSEHARLEGARLAVGIPVDKTYRCGKFFCATSPQSHIGPYRWAIDFLVPDGTPILAAHEGKVIEIHELSDQWGDGPEYRDLLNYMTIDHGNGEFSQYCHLAQKSVSQNGVEVGSLMKEGDQIGIVGKTGWTDRDHLHFCVFKVIGKNETPFTFKSLQPRFKKGWWPW